MIRYLKLELKIDKSIEILEQFREGLRGRT